MTTPDPPDETEAECTPSPQMELGASEKRPAVPNPVVKEEITDPVVKQIVIPWYLIGTVPRNIRLKAHAGAATEQSIDVKFNQKGSIALSVSEDASDSGSLKLTGRGSFTRKIRLQANEWKDGVSTLTILCSGSASKTLCNKTQNVQIITPPSGLEWGFRLQKFLLVRLVEYGGAKFSIWLGSWLVILLFLGVYCWAHWIGVSKFVETKFVPNSYAVLQVIGQLNGDAQWTYDPSETPIWIGTSAAPPTAPRRVFGLLAARTTSACNTNNIQSSGATFTTTCEQTFFANSPSAWFHNYNLKFNAFPDGGHNSVSWMARASSRGTVFYKFTLQYQKPPAITTTTLTAERVADGKTTKLKTDSSTFGYWPPRKDEMLTVELKVQGDTFTNCLTDVLDPNDSGLKENTPEWNARYDKLTGYNSRRPCVSFEGQTLPLFGSFGFGPGKFQIAGADADTNANTGGKEAK